MGATEFGAFTGIDVRRNAEVSDPHSVRVANNVDLSLGGAFKSRDGWRRVAILNSQSVGLYEVNGFLRAAIPCGQSLPPEELGSGVAVLYDAIGDGSAYPLSDIQRVTAWEGMGASASVGVFPYIVVKRASGKYEHHWIRNFPPTIASPVNTKVTLPFDPSDSIVKMQTKIWAPDNGQGAVYFSSTTNGPSDWTRTADAGFLPVISHVRGGRQVFGLGIYDNALVVMFEDSVQLWNVDPSPANMSLKRVMVGPGTSQQATVRNVLGDLFYFSRGGFRSMKTVALTGQIQENDATGGPVYPLTSVQSVAKPPVALWSQTRGAYFCAFGSTIFVFKNQPYQKLMGWTTYTMEWAVDYLIEVGGVIYARAGDLLYKLDDTYDEGIYAPFTVTTQFTDGGVPGKLKRWEWLELVQSGTSRHTLQLDPTNPAFSSSIGTVTGSTTALDRLFVGGMSRSASVAITGTGPWQLDRLLLRSTPCRF